MFAQEGNVITKPVDRDSEIKWKYQSIRLQAIAEVLSKPDAHLTEIERNLKRKLDVNNAPIEMTT
jgi:hypothetical protein